VEERVHEGRENECAEEDGVRNERGRGQIEERGTCSEIVGVMSKEYFVQWRYGQSADIVESEEALTCRNMS
jgi:hypothetical protein